jgi:hypothetical protein
MKEQEKSTERARRSKGAAREEQGSSKGGAREKQGRTNKQRSRTSVECSKR